MTQLSCENEFCIYQKQGTCVLEEVQLDIQGNCVDCIYINLEDEMLSNLKANSLKVLGSQKSDDF